MESAPVSQPGGMESRGAWAPRLSSVYPRACGGTDLRPSRHPVVTGTRGTKAAMTSRMASEWSLTDSPSSMASR